MWHDEIGLFVYSEESSLHRSQNLPVRRWCQSPRKEMMVRDQNDITVKWSKIQRLNGYLGSDLICLGCHNKIHKLFHKWQKYISCRPGTWEVQHQCAGKVVFILIPLFFGTYVAAISLCAFTISSSCLQIQEGETESFLVSLLVRALLPLWGLHHHYLIQPKSNPNVISKCHHIGVRAPT